MKHLSSIDSKLGALWVQVLVWAWLMTGLLLVRVVRPWVSSPWEGGGGVPSASWVHVELYLPHLKYTESPPPTGKLCIVKCYATSFYLMCTANKVSLKSKIFRRTIKFLILIIKQKQTKKKTFHATTTSTDHSFADLILKIRSSFPVQNLMFYYEWCVQKWSLLPYQDAFRKRWLELVAELFKNILILPEKKPLLIKCEKKWSPLFFLMKKELQNNYK